MRIPAAVRSRKRVRRLLVLPGTEGCRGYKDYRFHFTGFLQGCIYISVTAFLMAGLAYLVLKFMIW